MGDLEQRVNELTEQLRAQSVVVRDLREADAACDDVAAQEHILKDISRKRAAAIREWEKCPRETATGSSHDDNVAATGVVARDRRHMFDRDGLETLLRRRFFIAPAFEIYGGAAGLYDFGPPGCAVKNNLVQLWRRHFVLEEGMLELDGPTLTPESVLRASGHVDKFLDFMVKDTQTAAFYRADHVLSDALERMLGGNDGDDNDHHSSSDDNGGKRAAKSGKRDEASRRLTPQQRDEALAVLGRIDDMGVDELAEALREYEVRAPDTGNELSAPYPFNLMFQTQLGPTGNAPGYLRPETAQGIFVNFRRLLDYNGGRLPFACAQMGLSFRNEIAPRAGLLRVREFMQAEIEHFVHPERKQHGKFASVADEVLVLFPREQQMAAPLSAEHAPVRMRAGEAVQRGVIDNETLAYFIARTQAFAYDIGLRPEHVRFRQHMENEMAHYARDCWDLEVESSFGWIECAGLADRACFDLKAHTESSGVELKAHEMYDEPRAFEVLEAQPVKALIGKQFKRDAQTILAAIAEMDEARRERMRAALEAGTPHEVAGFAVTPDMVKFARVTKKVSGETYYPSVIEPSFGIGRLLYCVFEHAHYVRESNGNDNGNNEEAAAARAVLRLSPSIAPIKCSVLPLSKNDAFNPAVRRISELLNRAGVSHKVDDSGASIGKRYARTDEIGVPFGITVDFDTLADDTVTLRERDSTEQMRGPVADVVRVVCELVRGVAAWPIDARAALDAVASQDGRDERPRPQS